MTPTVRLQPGDVAPDFELQSTDRQKISWRDYAGKNVMLIFSPKDDYQKLLTSHGFAELQKTLTSQDRVFDKVALVWNESTDSRSGEARRTKSEWPVLQIPDAWNGVAKSYGLSWRWTIILIGADGKIISIKKLWSDSRNRPGDFPNPQTRDLSLNIPFVKEPSETHSSALGL